MNVSNGCRFGWQQNGVATDSNIEVDNGNRQQGKVVRKYGFIDAMDIDESDEEVEMQMEPVLKKQKVYKLSFAELQLNQYEQQCRARLDLVTKEWNDYMQIVKDKVQQQAQELAYKHGEHIMQQREKYLGLKDNQEAIDKQRQLQEMLRQRQLKNEQQSQNMIKALQQQQQRQRQEEERLRQQKELQLQRQRQQEEFLRKQQEEKERQKNQEIEALKKKDEEEKNKLLQAQQQKELLEKQRQEQERLQKEEKEKILQKQNQENARSPLVSQVVKRRETNFLALVSCQSALEEEERGATILKNAREQISDWSKNNSRVKTSINKAMTKEVSQISGTMQQVRKKTLDILNLLGSYAGVARICGYVQLANKIILQCESQVARLPTYVFPLAEVAATLGVSYPDFLVILLALLREKCILTVPKAFAFVKGNIGEESKIEYFLKMGYQMKKVLTENGWVEQLESSDEYIDRTMGYMRLIGALMQASNRDNRYGIENAWRWLARSLNCLPLNRATASSIYSVLQVSGYELNQRYKRQFQKLLQAVQEELVPKLQARKDSELSAIISNIKTFCHTREYQKPPQGKNMPLRDESQIIRA
eukprot:TRINITY_DN3006_c0_g1_i3.p2 TRINITY_DN3006_c0_g1~~TRINITY_DN3006_c0_g1_i3.p2  ORF type:complete len:591 (+),score=92.21 TRINITY_DN3006_c0_g1_i3:1496-3268(+)